MKQVPYRPISTTSSSVLQHRFLTVIRLDLPGQAITTLCSKGQLLDYIEFLMSTSLYAV